MRVTFARLCPSVIDFSRFYTLSLCAKNELWKREADFNLAPFFRIAVPLKTGSVKYSRQELRNNSDDRETDISAIHAGTPKIPGERIITA
jgi:hypothetical protein